MSGIHWRAGKSKSPGFCTGAFRIGKLQVLSGELTPSASERKKEPASSHQGWQSGTNSGTGYHRRITNWVGVSPGTLWRRLDAVHAGDIESLVRSPPLRSVDEGNHKYLRLTAERMSRSNGERNSDRPGFHRNTSRQPPTISLPDTCNRQSVAGPGRVNTGCIA